VEKNTLNTARDKILILLAGLISINCFTVKNMYGQAYNWTSLGPGTNGSIYAMVKDNNNNIIVGGKFTEAGGISRNNIAGLDASLSWFTMGSLTDSVTALVVFGSQLLAASGNKVYSWNGSSWDTLGSQFNGEVRALAIHRGSLIAGGLFTFADTIVNHIAIWNVTQSKWRPLAQGLNDDVYSLTVDNPGNAGVLYVGGRFNQAGGNSATHIAKWDVTAWSGLGSGMNQGGYVYSLIYRNSDSTLVVGGEFTSAGGISASRIASWKPATFSWSTIGSGMDNRVLSLSIYNNELVAGGIFKFAGGHYVDRIAKWNGTDWSRLITGTNRAVNCLFTDNANLFAGGQFTTAGGKYISHIALWNLQPTSTISGIVTYSDNGQPVPSGSKVKAVRLDVNTREIIEIDSTTTGGSGNYLLNNVRRDTNMYILSFPNDELINLAATYVPTYYPMAINWQNAVTVYPINNLTNIDISVFRITPGPMNPMAADCGGHVYLRFTPTLPGDENDVGLPYKSGSIVYAKQGNVYKGFGVSNTLEEYNIPQLAAGTYEMYAYRLGYTNAMRVVPLGNVSIDTIDFYLDTVSLIGIHQISSEVPREFILHQNYPNPFNPVTIIKFEVPSNLKRETSNVKMVVYDILGKEILTLVNEELKPGVYEVSWNAGSLASGLYFYKLVADEASIQTKKMVLIK
jgi:type IX secretion system substrate protein/cortical protein marker for cell polarity